MSFSSFFRARFLVLLVFITALSCQNDSANTLSFKKNGAPVIIRLKAAPDRLNPLTTTNHYASLVNEIIYSAPLQFNYETGELVPSLTQSRPSFTTDSTTGQVRYTFQLKENLTWDDGQPITPKDLTFTYKALFNPFVNSAPYRSFYSFIEDISTDSNTCTITSARPYILTEAALGTLPILPAHIYDPQNLMGDISLEMLFQQKADAFSEQEKIKLQTFAESFNQINFQIPQISGAGHYQIKEYVTDQSLTLERKSSYTEEAVSSIQYKIIPDQNTAFTALKAQEIDIITDLDVAHYLKAKEDSTISQYYNFYEQPTFHIYYIGMNNKSPFLDNKEVRRALAHLCDIETIIKQFYHNLAQVCNGPFPPARTYYDSSLQTIPLNIEKSIALLEQNGWKDRNGDGVREKMIHGQLMEMKLRYKYSSSSELSKNIALLLKGNAAKASIEIIPEAREFRAFIADLNEGDFELFNSAIGLDHLDDDPAQLWKSDAPGNRVGFGNEVSDALIENIRTELDPKIRKKLYLRFQQLVYDEQPVIFLFNPKTKMAVSKRISISPSFISPGYSPIDIKVLH